jgi:prolyl-tRNA editing enzyme YbaK/EbsC (Cys-tRNA(Pro) deacylase)
MFCFKRIESNGGKRGFFVEIRPRELVGVLSAMPVRINIERRG